MRPVELGRIIPNPEIDKLIDIVLVVVAVSLIACSLMSNLAPTPTATPKPTPTPRYVALPSAEDLTYMIAVEAGGGFKYLPWHYVPEDTAAWLIFGWPEEDDQVYKAVFGFVGGDWVLVGVERMGKETRSALDMETDDGKANAETQGFH
jgi:hypothetical protein